MFSDDSEAYLLGDVLVFHIQIGRIWGCTQGAYPSTSGIKNVMHVDYPNPSTLSVLVFTSPDIGEFTSLP